MRRKNNSDRYLRIGNKPCNQRRTAFTSWKRFYFTAYSIDSSRMSSSCSEKSSRKALIEISWGELSRDKGGEEEIRLPYVFQILTSFDGGSNPTSDRHFDEPIFRDRVDQEVLYQTITCVDHGSSPTSNRGLFGSPRVDLVAVSYTFTCADRGSNPT